MHRVHIPMKHYLLSYMQDRHAEGGVLAERVPKEQEPLQAQEFYNFFQMSSDLMIIGKLGGRVLKVNQGTVDVLGYSEEEFRFMQVLDLVHPDDRLATIEEHQHQIRTGKTIDFENRCMDKNGTWHRLSWRARYDDKTRLSYATARDITQYKKDEEDLRRMQKLSSLGVLAGGIAHDFNNILTIMFGNIALAKNFMAPDHLGFSCLEQAEVAFQRATHLTSQLLTFAKGGEPVMQDVSISALINDVVRFDLSGSSVRLEFTPPPRLWQARVDKGQISQVFSNLATNANQAMPEGGHLYITIENCLLERGDVSGIEPGKYLKFEVRDEGVGISRADIEKIFDPYFTTKRRGSGLGLATVYSIVTRHGGHISVESSLGLGTTFTLYLPASELFDSGHDAAFQLVPDAEPEQARLLVMDDEDMIGTLCSNFLTAQGYEVARARDGREAIAIYETAMREGKPFDCMIMDLTIPGGMSGKQALAEILKLNPSAKAIVSSGYDADPVMANYQTYGFTGSIAKPFRLAALHQEIKRVLASPVS